MKQRLFLAVMLAGLCATAQQASQPKTNDQPAPTQADQNATQTQSDKNAAQPQPEQAAQPADKDKDKTAAATPPTAAAQPAAEKSKGCLAVKPIGSHAFRNIMLAGVAGAIISKQQYKVTDVADYPVATGTKYHGNDLQTISQNGTKVVILDKNVKDDVATKACH
jgi:hypothetical protein